MRASVVSAHSRRTNGGDAAKELAGQIGADPKTIVFFHSPGIDGGAVSGRLRDLYPGTIVVGASSCGEFTDEYYGIGGVAALAFGEGIVKRCAGAIADFEHGVELGIREATGQLSAAFGGDLRELDPRRCVGIVLLEGTRMREEVANHALGQVAPLLSFVGGSAGDDIALVQSHVHCNERTSLDGASLLLIETNGPFEILKTSSFEPTEHEFRVTKSDRALRRVYELDGKPAAEVYAECLGVPVSELGLGVFLRHPLGLMIDGEPWLRSLVRVVDGGGFRMACEVIEGTRLHVMRGHDIIAATALDLDRAAEKLGTPVRGGLLFNCVHRRLEIEATNREADFVNLLRRFPLAGFHTHGESWLGHINQTLTALLFG